MPSLLALKQKKRKNKTNRVALSKVLDIAQIRLAVYVSNVVLEFNQGYRSQYHCYRIGCDRSGEPF